MFPKSPSPPLSGTNASLWNEAVGWFEQISLGATQSSSLDWGPGRPVSNGDARTQRVRVCIAISWSISTTGIVTGRPANRPRASPNFRS